jgi:hypothetical protein
MAQGLQHGVVVTDRVVTDRVVTDRVVLRP